MSKDVKAIFSKCLARRAWCAMLLALTLAACAGMQWHKPQVSLADVRVTGGNLLESHLLLKLRVHNENDKDITLDGLTFDMQVGDFVLARGARNEPIVLARMADTIVDIDATARTLDLLRRLPQLVQSDGRVEYVVRGEALIHDYGRVPFDHKDSLDISKFTGGSGRVSPPAASSGANLQP
jgi:LEA14-like dessication related protein